MGPQSKSYRTKPLAMNLETLIRYAIWLSELERQNLRFLRELCTNVRPQTETPFEMI